MSPLFYVFVGFAFVIGVVVGIGLTAEDQSHKATRRRCDD